MPRILVSNDDGIDSPTLVPLVRALQPLGETRVVVPSTERSWIGKAITRFDPVRVYEVERGGMRMYSVTGFPADCVNLGVHTLYADKPDLVVSGINIGLNFTMAFLISSGTVGAALEAWIAGVPSIAFSMAVPHDAYGLAGLQRIEALGDRPTGAAAAAADIVGTLWREGFPGEADTFSVNMPADTTIDTPREITRVTRSRYGSLFVPGPEGDYVHQFTSLWPTETPEDGDMRAFERGSVSIAPLRLDMFAKLPDRLERALVGKGNQR